MSVLTAGLAAAAFGIGDFLGGIAARGTDWRRVAAISLGAGLVPIGVAAAFNSHSLEVLSWSWCLLAAVGFVCGVSLLYRALAAGHMSEVAPITAIVAIAGPAIFDIATGAALSFNLIVGLTAAVLCSVLIAGPMQATTLRSANLHLIGTALTAGAGLAVFYIALDRLTGAGAGIASLFAIRAMSFAMIALFALKRSRGPFDRMSTPAAVAAGVIDGVATILLLWAFGSGPLAQTAAIASLYPVSTILLAMLILRERPTAVQCLGLAMAIPAILLLKST